MESDWNRSDQVWGAIRRFFHQQIQLPRGTEMRVNEVPWRQSCYRCRLGSLLLFYLDILWLPAISLFNVNNNFCTAKLTFYGINTGLNFRVAKLRIIVKRIRPITKFIMLFWTFFCYSNPFPSRLVPAGDDWLLFFGRIVGVERLGYIKDNLCFPETSHPPFVCMNSHASLHFVSHLLSHFMAFAPPKKWH